jgi:hypothetical protein
MPSVALDNATGMAQSMHAGCQRQVKHQAAADCPVLPENRSIALGNLHVHSRIPRRLAGMVGGGVPCLRVP